MRSNLLLAASLIVTMSLMAAIVYHVTQLNKALVMEHGTLKEFKKRWAGARSDRVNMFKTEEHDATFTRAYSGLSRVFAANRAADLLEKPEGNTIAEKYSGHQKLKAKQERLASFYILASDQSVLNNHSTQEVDYFYLKLSGDDQSKLGYYTDLYTYVVKEKIGMLITILSFMLSLGLVAFAASVNTNIPINNKLYGSCIVLIVFIHLFIILF